MKLGILVGKSSSGVSPVGNGKKRKAEPGESLKVCSRGRNRESKQKKKGRKGLCNGERKRGDKDAASRGGLIGGVKKRPHG